MSTTANSKAHRNTNVAMAAVEGLVLSVVCLSCIVGMFLCGGVIFAMLHDPLPVLVLACLFCAGTMVTVGEVMKPVKRRRARKA